MTKFLVLSVLAVSSSGFAALSAGELCPKWSLPSKEGELNSKIVGESSGIAVSRAADVLYHMNDSGTGPEFHVSKRDGSALTSVHIENYSPIDPEEIALGPCALTQAHTCLVIEDIGDNLKRRKSIGFFFIEEKTPFPRSVKPEFVARFQYPDGAHNAEAATVLDNGDAIIVTKELSLLGVASAAQVFRAKRADYLKATNPAKPLMLEKIGEIDLPAINLQKGLGGVATGLAAIPSGKRFTILTYTGAIEFSVDLKAAKLPSPIPTANRKIVPLFQLPQQESIAYDKNDRDLVYSTEIMQRIFGFGVPAPIYKVRCNP